jgi:hypothetical protein
MGNEFSLEDYESMENQWQEEDAELKPVGSDDDGEYFDLSKALPVREDGISPMTDDTSRGYFDFSDSTEFFETRTCLIKDPGPEDTERIISGSTNNSSGRFIYVPTEKVRLSVEGVLGDNTANPFLGNPESAKGVANCETLHPFGGNEDEVATDFDTSHHFDRTREEAKTRKLKMIPDPSSNSLDAATVDAFADQLMRIFDK